MSLEEKVNSFDGHNETFQQAAVEPAVEERKLVRKLDMRIMPILCILYLFGTNLGNARLQGLPQDTLHGDPTGVLFDWVNSVFFFPYVICQVPAIITSKLFPPRIWMGCTALGWGLCSTLTATAFNFPGLLVARIGLGVFEAGFAPGIPLYMSFYYTRREIGVRLAYFFGFAAVAGACGGLIAFGVQHIHASVSNWRLLFIIEGCPTILLGLMMMLLLPDRPEETTFLNEKERELAIDRMNRGLKADVGRTVNTKHITAAFKDWRVYAVGVIFFAANCALVSISAFLPTILTTLGFVLTVPPYAAAAIVLCIISWFSDRLQNRGLFVAGVSTLAALGYILLLAVKSNNHVRYFAVFCITSGTYSVIGIVIAWFAHNLGSESKKATGIPMYMSIGQCGSVLGSHIYPSTEEPHYVKGFAITCALQLLSAIVAIIVSVEFALLSFDNRRRDQKYGKVDPDATVDTSELADKAPGFRYVP